MPAALTFTHAALRFTAAKSGARSDSGDVMTATMAGPQTQSPRLSRVEQQALNRVVDWFKTRGWSPFRFQRQAWTAARCGESGLIHATTGTGKTYAAWMGPILQWLAEPRLPATSRPRSEEPLRVLWVTPLRALAADTMQALQAPLTDLQIPWTLEARTGDTSASVRNRQRQRLPTALITTPESLSLLLSREDAERQFGHLQSVIVDEWHELLSTKRGVQTELCLAHLRNWRPNLQTWGLSATLGNTEQAMKTLLGQTRSATAVTISETESSADDLSPRFVDESLIEGTLIRGVSQKRMAIDSVIPATIERFPWAGHLGLRLLQGVVEEIDRAATSLVFTNTRSQTEAWYQGLLRARPDWAGKIALHHGSLDRSRREWVEDKLRDGQLKCVVCTSTLDLGVDFAPVERVFQVGSPKGIARLLQRAGRSGHSPGRESRVTFVPAHALELLEIAAARDAVEAGRLESRIPPSAPMDVLTQHATTMALGGGFDPDDLFAELRTTTTYADLPRSDFDWVVDFISTGGHALKAYPEYQKVRQGTDGRFHLDDKRLATQHRLSIGTIVGDGELTVQYLKGARLGTIEESFLARLTPGDRFIFAGNPVELVQVRDSTVWVRRAKVSSDIRMPRWMGGRMPLSSELSDAIRLRLDEAAQGNFRGPEMRALRPLLDLQAEWSRIPRRDELLIERVKSRDGYHLYLYPFAGRLVHEGLGAVLAYRLSRLAPITFSISVNDYGLELLSPTEPPWDEALKAGLFDSVGVGQDITACMNSVEMAKREFREVASIAGLIFKGLPGRRKSAGQMQASSGLLFDVFSEYDPGNLLLRQTRRDVLEKQLELTRLVRTLDD
ncbi:MAG TPA: ligase-associated DNA damage response DEXH box helicase, partial [Planctomycetaceae bacterium]|nr:ligase-associated DNA damage response DEXH box helicase [Planctomycetaceae bacterium]